MRQGPEPARRWPGLAVTAPLAVVLLSLPAAPTHAQDDGEPQAEGEDAEEGDDAEAQADGSDADAEEDAEERAREHFELGRSFYEAGRFLEAAQEFEQAYAISERHELLYNIFLARRDAGQIGKAIDALERYLELVEDIDNRSALEARLRTMRRLHDQAGAGSDDGDETPDGPADDEEQAEADGDGDGASDAGEPPPPPAPRDEEGGPSALPWTVAGVGGAMLVGGVVTGVLALKKESDLEGRCERVADDTFACEPGFENDKNKGAALATATDVLVASGLAFVGAGLALFFMLDDDGAPERASASIGCDGHGCAGSVRMAF